MTLLKARAVNIENLIQICCKHRLCVHDRKTSQTQFKQIHIIYALEQNKKRKQMHIKVKVGNDQEMACYKHLHFHMIYVFIKCSWVSLASNTETVLL